MIIGYTKDRIAEDPFRLVIGERKLLVSVPGPKRDLEDILQLARGGRLRAMIQNQFFLHKVNEVLELLRKRKSLGRNVVSF